MLTLRPHLLYFLCVLVGSAYCLPEKEGNLVPLQYANASIDYSLGIDLGNYANTMSLDLRDLENLSKRQRRECPAGTTSCSAGSNFCRQPGYQCCPNDQSTACRIGKTCCTGQAGCADSGYFCCPGKTFLCPNGSKCCPEGDGNCVVAGGVCCGEVSCRAGEKCCGDGNCAPKDAECCGEGYCDPGKTCCGNGLACAQEGNICCKDMRHSCPQGNQCCQDQDGPYCASKCLPTLKFPHVEGITDEIQKNTCKGLREYFRKNGNNEFTWNGPGARKINRKKRRAAGCGGRKKCPAGYNCDEFPMASTGQGGAGASIECVPDWLNGFYGYLWNSFRAEQVASGGFSKNNKFRIILQGCDHTTIRKAKAKREVNEIVSSSHDNLTVFAGSAFGNMTQGNNVIFLPLTPATGNPGTYTFDYSLTGGETIESGWIMDEDGERYKTLDALQNGDAKSTSFQLEDADDGPVYFFGWTKAKDVQMSVSIKSPPPSTTTSTIQEEETASATTSATTSAVSTSATSIQSNASDRLDIGFGTWLHLVLVIAGVMVA